MQHEIETILLLYRDGVMTTMEAAKAIESLLDERAPPPPDLIRKMTAAMDRIDRWMTRG